MDINPNMSNGEVTVPADSFDKTKHADPNVAPSLVNVTLGGTPQHWLNSTPISRFDLKRDAGVGKILKFDEFKSTIEENLNKNTKEK
jgi:hypothetical protein